MQKSKNRATSQLAPGTRRRFTRQQILQSLRKCVEGGEPIIGAGCSAGIIAKCAELGGADLIIAYSTGLSRLKGYPTTPYGPMDSNDVTLGMVEELLRATDHTPIVGGIDASDPGFRDPEDIINKYLDAGFSGIINYPTIKVYEGRFSEEREGQGFGWTREVNLMKKAREMGVLTVAYVFSAEDARTMAQIPVDVMCPHAGGTAGGKAGYKARLSLEAAARNVQRMIEATRDVDKGILCLAHGGPFSEPIDTKYLYEHTDAVGFVGASSIERIPVERAVEETVRAYKSYSTKKAKGKTK